MRSTIAVAALLLGFFAAATSIAAQPVITRISPDSAPAAGGTEVTIIGSGFETCRICSPAIPPEVIFGDHIPSPSVTLVDANTLRAIVPAQLPGTVRVTVRQHNGSTTRENAFTYTGRIEEGFDRVLVPLLTGPVNGAFGSRFITELRLANSSNTQPTYFFGLLPICRISACIFVDPLRDAYFVQPGGVYGPPESFEHAGQPGQFLFIPKSAPRIDMNLRVYDETRSAFNFGTEIPLVYDRELTTEPVKLLGVPLDPRFRNTLRIYATAETTVSVAFADTVHLLTLQPPDTPWPRLYPAYAQFSDFPTGAGTIDVTITPSTVIPPMPGLEPPRVWAFISVTNNDTQLITTITPHR